MAVIPALLLLGACAASLKTPDDPGPEALPASAFRAEPKAPAGAPAAAYLPDPDSPSGQLAAYWRASKEAGDRGDLQRAHVLMVAATALKEADASHWLLRANWAWWLEDLSDVAVALKTIAARWPAAAREDWKFVYQAVDRMGRLEALHQTYLELLEALYQAEFTVQHGAQPDELWEDLILDALQRKDLPRALAISARVESTQTVLRMRIDRRFDPVVQADPERFDLLAAARNRAVALQRVMTQYPRELDGFVQYAYALFEQGRHLEVLQQCNAILATLEKTGTQSSPYDDLDQSLNWVYNHKASALRALGRWEEALVVMETAQTLAENDHVNVSQVINLGDHYLDAGRPEQALRALDDLECSQAVSAYGCTQLNLVRYRAHLQLGDRKAAQEALNYLRAHREEFEEAWTWAALQSGDLDTAADLLIRQLKDPKERTSALESAQDFLQLPMTPTMQAEHDRWQQVLARPDVAAAIEAVGRRVKLPIYEMTN